MAIIENLTPFQALGFPSADKTGCNLHVFCVAGRFILPKGGQRAQPALHEEQHPPLLADAYWGDPAQSSLRYEGQGIYGRPNTDIYVLGHARTPDAKPLTQMLTRVRVGALEKCVEVMGDRTWESALLKGVKPSPPLPFREMPLRWERAYGGQIPVEEGQHPRHEPRNPVGRGFYKNNSAALDQPLPNLEDPKYPLKGLGQHPPPCNYGPIPRHWLPRAQFCGTYDQAWQENRAPFWPEDLDERFFQAAAPGMCYPGYLQGGEAVYLEGFCHEGPQAFPLPSYQLLARARFTSGAELVPLVLDALCLDTDDECFTMIWRGSVSTQGRMAQLQATTIRLVAPWEAGL